MNARDILTREEWGQGLLFGARLENRVATEAIVTSLLAVLGKDTGDGAIDLGVLGYWRVTAEGAKRDGEAQAEAALATLDEVYQEEEDLRAAERGHY